MLDANDGMGMVVSKMAMDMAIEKAKKYGTACWLFVTHRTTVSRDTDSMATGMKA